MSAASLAGFALVFVVTAWTLSALAGVAIGFARRFGPLVERRAAVAAAIVPVGLAIVVAALLIAQSVLGEDHCPVHDHHAHLCLAHGTHWLELPWVAAMLAIAGVTVLARGALLVGSAVRGARSIRALHALSTTRDGVRIVESDRAFCFVAGRRAAVYVSSRVWVALTASERAALVAHERAHVEHGDLKMRAILEGVLVFATPLVGERIRRTWLDASERLCDARAAAATGEPESVASAMVALCRIHATRPAASFGFTPTAAELVARVEAVLAGKPLGERAAGVFARAVTMLTLALVVGAAVAAEPLHHVFETLLG